MNPDVELLDDGLARLAQDALAGGALLAPRLLNADGSVQDSAHPLPGPARDARARAPSPPVLPTAVRALARRAAARGRAGRWRPASSAGPTSSARSGPFDPDAFLFYEDMELCLGRRRAGIPTILRPDVAVRHLGGTSTARALAEDRDLELRARRRREVMAEEGRGRLAVDDLSEALTFATRAAARSLAGRGELERRRLKALVRARR